MSGKEWRNRTELRDGKRSRKGDEEGLVREMRRLERVVVEIKGGGAVSSAAIDNETSGTSALPRQDVPTSCRQRPLSPALKGQGLGGQELYLQKSALLPLQRLEIQECERGPLNLRPFGI